MSALADPILDEWRAEFEFPGEPGLVAPPAAETVTEHLEVQPFQGLTHDEVLELELPAERYLVDGMIPAGTVGVIAGVPETGKTFLAQAIAHGCARGAGDILGFPVSRQIRVGYFWQDDSTREELERIRVFEAAHASPPGLPLRWYLNEDLRLPRDADRLRAAIAEHDLELVIGDSFYTIADGVDLKDSGPEEIVVQLKREICDRTGCAVALIDHMPWATETNRQRLRAYGGVFKAAATRWGIYLDVVGSSLHVEVRGNNIRGFKKRPAYFDADTLEIRLVDNAPDEPDQAHADALTWIHGYVSDHFPIARGKVETAYHEAHGGHGRNLARKLIDRQITAWNDHITAGGTGEAPTDLATGPGEIKNGTYLYPSSHAPSPLAAQPNGEGGEVPAAASTEDPLATLATRPIGGEGSGEQGSSPPEPAAEETSW